MEPGSHSCGVTWHLILSIESDCDERENTSRSQGHDS
jgi:hypothetical protein